MGVQHGPSSPSTAVSGKLERRARVVFVMMSAQRPGVFSSLDDAIQGESDGGDDGLLSPKSLFQLSTKVGIHSSSRINEHVGAAVRAYAGGSWRTLAGHAGHAL